MRNHQIPPAPDDLERIADNVRPAYLARHQIA
jgi:hypothetical protein